jgi:hypothetical protein
MQQQLLNVEECAVSRSWQQACIVVAGSVLHMAIGSELHEPAVNFMSRPQQACWLLHQATCSQTLACPVPLQSRGKCAWLCAQMC